MEKTGVRRADAREEEEAKIYFSSRNQKPEMESWRAKYPGGPYDDARRPGTRAGRGGAKGGGGWGEMGVGYSGTIVGEAAEMHSDPSPIVAAAAVAALADDWRRRLNTWLSQHQAAAGEQLTLEAQRLDPSPFPLCLACQQLGEETALDAWNCSRGQRILLSLQRKQKPPFLLIINRRFEAFLLAPPPGFCWLGLTRSACPASQSDRVWPRRWPPLMMAPSHRLRLDS
ncbi:hypothetical protein G7046_g6204 [Stylonectria norvegica]|nr:hypothetical protein G7046_g6204 [Stylonectria norvegica]